MVLKAAHRLSIRFRTDQNQRGAALLTVLLVTSLLTIMAVAMVSRQQLDIRRTANIIQGDQAYWLAKGGETWAVNLLNSDQRKGNTDTLAEEWAQGLSPVEVAGGMISGNIVDLQGRFNLNNLLSEDSTRQEKSRRQFSRLLTSCSLSAEILNAAVDWLDDDGDSGWAEDWAYASLETPYRTANQLMRSSRELLQVQGMTAKGYQCLEPLVCALPVPTPININTAPAMILASLADGISLAQAENLVASRPNSGYEEIADFLSAIELAGSTLTDDNLSLSSNFFMVQAKTSMGRAQCLLFSLIQRQNRGVQVVQRTIGTY